MRRNRAAGARLVENTGSFPIRALRVRDDRQPVVREASAKGMEGIMALAQGIQEWTETVAIDAGRG